MFDEDGIDDSADCPLCKTGRCMFSKFPAGALVIDPRANIRRVHESVDTTYASKRLGTFKPALMRCECGVDTLVKPGVMETCECGQTTYWNQ